MNQKKSSTQTLVSYASDGESVTQRNLIRLIEAACGRKRLQKIYDAMHDEPLNGENYWGKALDVLNIELNVNMERLKSFGASGPLVIIANHPFGVVDGLALCHLAAQIRPEFKVILHKVLCQDERIASHVLPIDFSGSREAMRDNVRTKQEAEKILKAGGSIVIFPAGGVSTAPKPFAKATDLDWKPMTSKLIKSSRASVLPIYFSGQNSWLFQLVSQFSSTLRTGLLLNEVRNKMDTCLDVTIGNLIPYDDLAALDNQESMLEYLRQAIYALAYDQNTHWSLG